MSNIELITKEKGQILLEKDDLKACLEQEKEETQRWINREKQPLQEMILTLSAENKQLQENVKLFSGEGDLKSISTQQLKELLQRQKKSIKRIEKAVSVNELCTHFWLIY